MSENIYGPLEIVYKLRYRDATLSECEEKDKNVAINWWDSLYDHCGMDVSLVECVRFPGNKIHACEQIRPRTASQDSRPLNLCLSCTARLGGCPHNHPSTATECESYEEDEQQ